MGVGNLLWADEGFGVRCAEALEAALGVSRRRSRSSTAARRAWA